MEVIRGEKVHAWWFDPRTGGSRPGGDYPNTGVRTFVPPDLGEMLDWVLVLDDAAKKYPVPPALRR